MLNLVLSERPFSNSRYFQILYIYNEVCARDVNFWNDSLLKFGSVLSGPFDAFVNLAP